MAKKNWTDQELMNAVESSHSIRNVIIKLGLVPAGGNYATVKNFIKKHDIDTSHFTGQGHNRGKTRDNGLKGGRRAKLLSEILVRNSFYQSHKLRLRLIKEDVFPHECSKCHLTVWLGHPIPLELEHVNGVCDDNRLENLCLLCPNCHALTSTYRGRNIKK